MRCYFMLLAEDESLSAVNYCQITVHANDAYIKYRFKLKENVTSNEKNWKKVVAMQY
jgi:hypothetical protein